MKLHGSTFDGAEDDVNFRKFALETSHRISKNDYIYIHVVVIFSYTWRQVTSPQTGCYMWNWLWYSQLGLSTISVWNLQRVDVSWSPFGFMSLNFPNMVWEVTSCTGQVECDYSSEKHETQDILSNYLLLHIVSIFAATKYPKMTLFEWLCSCKLLTTDDKLHPNSANLQ